MDEVSALRGTLFSDQSRYGVVKEKLIGFTIDYQTYDFESVIRNIVNIYEDPYGTFLNDNINVIINVFNRSCISNLRILKHALSRFRVVYETMDKMIEKDKAAISCTRVLYSFLTWCMEYDSGRLEHNVSAISSIKSDMDIAFIVRRDGQLSRFMKDYTGRYYPEQKAYNFSPQIFQYVTTGYWDFRSFEEYIQTEFNTVEPGPLPPVKLILGDYLRLSEEDFSRYCEDLYHELKDGRFALLTYSRAIANYYVFSTEGLFPNTVDQILEDFKIGAKKSSANNPIYDPGFDTLVRQTSMPPKISQYLEFLKEINNSNKAIQEKSSVSLLEKLMEENFDEFCMELYDRDKRYSYISIFKYLDIETLFDKLMNVDNSDFASFIGSLNGRYSFANIDEFFKSDLDGLNRLVSKIDANLNAANIGALRIYALKRLKKTIQDICSRLE